MYSTTLCFVVDGLPARNVLLGMKKNGFGKGKYNGFGGKIEQNEGIKAAVLRELEEECGLIAAEQDLEKVGELDFIFPEQPAWDHDVHIYIVKRWQGGIRETEEMKPEWFPVAAVPYATMWQDDIHWLPQVLQGEKIKGEVQFAADNESVRAVTITAVSSF
ncbi:8-oxo-dGTP diphosphatase [Anaerospora hongkongensis]|uniref:Oxidized purine nucleoside triphosphate hydrolase n=1 Tax=Anaerospora hongkongensis TaxID=244830 RepID=A0A4R1Q3T8_9FIRM|nr:8-oxo-dGTP diphosphatase [Anaerospora hongkongensis]TCL39423.1 8-oxo-dGTP diphosphatase [Anaerospora hongkongensis]